MKLTNKFNLPDTFLNVIARPSYSKGNSEISVTEILSPPQLVLLRRRHADDIEIDAADQVWSCSGQQYTTSLSMARTIIMSWKKDCSPRLRVGASLGRLTCRSISQMVRW